MAVSPTSSKHNHNGSVSAKKDKFKSPNAKSKKEKNSQKKKKACEKGLSSPPKRNSNPGVRLIRGRIYDSQNGKTCHQCRQKTRDFAALCKNVRNDKPCPVQFCHKCLLNRYGEKAEEVGVLQEWVCPKCRGICNCSQCMKKRGQQPTGILVHAAKANGYSSVSEMLQNNGSDNCHQEKSENGISGFSRKRAAPEMVAMTISSRKRGKENNFDGKINSNLHAQLWPSYLVEKSKKVMVGGPNVVQNDSAHDPVDSIVVQKKSKKSQDKRKEIISKEDCDSLVKQSSPPGGERKSEKMKMRRSNEKLDRSLMKQPDVNLHEKKLKTLKHDKPKKLHQCDTFVRRTSPRKYQISHGNSSVDATSKIVVDPEERKLSNTQVFLEGLWEPLNKNKEKLETCDGGINGDAFVKRTSPRKHQILNETSNDDANSTITVVSDERKLSKAKVHVELVKNGTQASTGLEGIKKHKRGFENNDVNIEISLPKGFELTSVQDIEMPPEDIGKAFQFLEFCAVFGKILGVKKGQPEAILRDLIHGRSSRRGKNSVTVQFLIQLLSVIQKKQEGSSALCPTGKGSWIDALNECIFDCASLSKSLELNYLDKRSDGFADLDTSKKLMILNFLCDEILGTKKIRSWMDEKAKEHKESLLAAKDKEKSLKQKLQDEIAKTILQDKNGVFSISEHDAIVSEIEKEVAAAHTEQLQNKQWSDVLRADQIYLGIDGRAYWRLKTSSNKSELSGILLQDVGTGDNSASNEKWFGFADEQKEVIEKHISSLRGKRLRPPKVPQQPQNEDAQEARE